MKLWAKKIIVPLISIDPWFPRVLSQYSTSISLLGVSVTTKGRPKYNWDFTSLPASGLCLVPKDLALHFTRLKSQIWQIWEYGQSPEVAGKINALESQMEHKINFHLNLTKTVVKDHPWIFIKINMLFGRYLDWDTSKLDTQLFYSNCLDLFFVVGTGKHGGPHSDFIYCSWNSPMWVHSSSAKIDPVLMLGLTSIQKFLFLLNCHPKVCK